MGITGGFRRGAFHLRAAYFDAVEAAGGVPLLVPPCKDDGTLRVLLTRLDALVISGGRDVRPCRYGQTVHPETRPVSRRREEFDFRCLAAAMERGLPILAICYGTQLLNVFSGGSLLQDIEAAETKYEYHKPAEGAETFHTVRIEHGTKLAQWLGTDELEVNSSHHQAIDRIGSGLRVAARTGDGLIEAIESADDRFLLGVQWHPERLLDRPAHLKLFSALIALCGCSRRGC